METHQSDRIVSDLEHSAAYTPLPDNPSSENTSTPSRRPLKGGFVVILGASAIFLLSLIGIILNQTQQIPLENPEKSDRSSLSTKTTSFSNISRPLLARGVAEGVSAKSYPSQSNQLSYNWTNAMFSWQRTAFHFQPQKNWMNGPLYHKGWYHLFYQYNPDSAIWGNITWGHAVSRDLIHWLYLPIAMVPDRWFDINGVWTGSATLLPNGNIVMLYTGDTNEYVQVQNLAYPANLSDPLLLNWVKYDGNPVLFPPPGIGPKDFRDPTTAWIGPDGKWRITVGSRVNKTLGISLVYKTTNFTTYDLHDQVLHAVPGTGTYYSENDTWVPDNPEEDVGIGLQVDYGRYYASKTFYDQQKERRVLWGWINETDTENDDLRKGWASVQTIPRTVLFDSKTGTNVLQWPVEEIESLRLNSTKFEGVVVEPGSVVPLDIGTATQLDIIAEFEIESLTSEVTDKNDDVGCGGGAIDRSALGPFGILVIADQTLSELTPVYFRPSNSTTFFCTDQTRSSKAPDITKRVYGSKVPVLSDENLSMRVLVDHSIIESFGQGGRTLITSRVYPTEAIYGAARIFLFNNATGVKVKASLKIWQLNSAFIRPFRFDQDQTQ
ncbi:acid beta-fructofuranosidase-like [Quillaja saponaria]|uniref:beta-fructofuranosidase n=1 Tax=Quillaja saponaria TaxID=32244 RepID=A0AAD7QJA4_QUISA|nr:acid beta-fructofuranosidase-like [Quillaja saponaria]